MYKIYKITNLINSKQYVGLTKLTLEKRFHQHTKRGFILNNAIAKYGKENFIIELIEEVQTAKKAYNKEQFYISHFNTKNLNGYNLTDGGDGLYGVVCTEETRKKYQNTQKKIIN